MKRIFNFRPIFLAFVGLFCGAFFCSYIFSGALWIKISLAVLIICCFALSFLKIDFFKSRKVAVWILLATLVVGFFYGSLKITNYKKNQINGNNSIYGTVNDKIIYGSNYATLTLKNVYASSKSVDGNLKLTIFGDISSSIDAGDELYFSSMVNSYDIINDDGSINSYMEKSSYKFYSSVNLEDVIVKKGEPTFFEKIRISSRQNILKNTSSEEIGNLIYSVIFGDKTYLSDDVYSTFSLSGCAHLLAVSGLHVGFIVAVLLAVLNLCKCKKWLKLVLISLFLIGYNVLCGFSPSIVRASLMSVLLLLAYLFGERHDMLSSVGLAGILILIFKPLMACDVGFCLSFGAVIGILCLTKPISKLFLKIKFPKFLASALAVCLASNIGTIPFVALTFKNFAYIGLLSNVITIPLFAIAFSFAFVVFLLGLILPFINALFGICEIGFLFVYKICKIFAFFEPFKIAGMGFLLLLIFALIFLVSEFSFLKKHIKKGICFCFVAVLCVSFAFANFPAKIKNSNLVYLENEATILLSKENEIVIVSQTFNDYEIEKAQDYLFDANLEKLLVGVVISGEAKNMNDVYAFAKENDDVQVVVSNNCFIDDEAISQVENLSVFDGEMTVGHFSFNEIVFYNHVLCVNASFDNKKVMFLNSISSDEIEYLNHLPIEVDAIVCNYFKKAYNYLRIKTKNFVVATAYSKVYLDLVITNNLQNYKIDL